MDFHLIEAVLAPLDHEEIGEDADIGQIEIGARGNAFGPFARVVDRRRAQAEIGVGVVGDDEQRPPVRLDIIFDAGFARTDEDGRGERIVRGEQADFGRRVVARRDDNPLAVMRHPDAALEAGVFFMIDHDVIGDVGADAVRLDRIDAPLLVNEAIKQMRVVGAERDCAECPFDRAIVPLAARAGNGVGQIDTGLQVAEMNSVAFGAVVIDRIGHVATVFA